MARWAAFSQAQVNVEKDAGMRCAAARHTKKSHVTKLNTRIVARASTSNN